MKFQCSTSQNLQLPHLSGHGGHPQLHPLQSSQQRHGHRFPVPRAAGHAEALQLQQLRRGAAQRQPRQWRHGAAVKGQAAAEEAQGAEGLEEVQQLEPQV